MQLKKDIKFPRYQRTTDLFEFYRASISYNETPACNLATIKKDSYAQIWNGWCHPLSSHSILILRPTFAKPVLVKAIQSRISRCCLHQ